MTTANQRQRALDLMNAAQREEDPHTALLNSIAHLIALVEHDETNPESTEPDFPADSAYEVWEFHGETPIRKINPGMSENGYATFGAAAKKADQFAASEQWTRGKTDPSFRVVTVVVTRTLVRTPSAVARPSTSTSTSAGRTS